MSASPYFDAFSAGELLGEYPVGEEFLARFSGMSRDELSDLQQRRFLALVEWGWQIPFYRRLWTGAGVAPGDIASLEDCSRLPVYDKSDLMESVAAHPPLGDFAAPEGVQLPMVVHTTSGTTGSPQPLIFGPRGREIQNILLARAYRLQGLDAGAVVQSCYGHGMINGGHYVREAFLHYTDALFLSAGTGVETPSVRQVALMQSFGVNTLVGFADYIRKLAGVARECGIEPGCDIRIRMISGHLGLESREELSELWGGPELFDWYGVGDTGAIAAEGADHAGMYVWEDAQRVELLDVETGELLVPEPEARGEMVVTCLYKTDAFPVIRFNTHDITEVLGGAGGFDLPFRRIAGFRGRADNMVKLRGINIYPQAVGAALQDIDGCIGEYVCIVERDASGRDELTVQAEATEAADAADAAALHERCLERLHQALGIAVAVELTAPGGTAALTEINSRQKPLRLIDRRNLEGR
ncbi:MAG: phenylacetate--CoA ligase family protein [Gammaproteobacteria bacterium AqS3]|nr:phenylacetate--CoA ligase family protein [Gammaproteobacteria bacterium AqS3]